MEDIIRQGALRLLTSEASCDVILSCAGHRLMAHKVILSIASPLLQSILLEENSTPAVIILPEIQTSTMTLILDYIYTGNTHVPHEKIKDFLDAASLLQIQICNESAVKLKFPKCPLDLKECPLKLHKAEVSTKSEENASKTEEKIAKKNLRKIPNLLPIRSRKTAYSHVIPSPWCPRIAPLIGDPRVDTAVVRVRNKEVDKNDTNNNNFQVINFVQKKSSYQNVPWRTEISPPKIIDEPPKITEDSTKTHEGLTKVLEEKSKLSEGKTKPDEADPKEDDVKESEMSRLEAKSHENSPKKIETVNASKNDNHKYSNKPFKCEECGKSFSQLRNYKYHRSIHEGTKEFSARCPECGKTFNDKGYLSSHMKIHRDRKEYGCPHCPKRFNQRVAYNMHLRIHTGLKPHECPTCGKTFSRKMLLKQHQRVHTGERPYSCPECGKTFADRSNMSLHARLHTGVKPYSCNLCSKSFTKKHHLKTHMNFHTGLKPYSCQKCGLSFSQSSNMRTHYKKCILKPNSESSENT